MTSITSPRKIYKKTHKMTAFYELIDTHNKIITQTKHYTIINMLQ